MGFPLEEEKVGTQADAEMEELEKGAGPVAEKVPEGKDRPSFFYETENEALNPGLG